jgi:hypothetical protein
MDKQLPEDFDPYEDAGDMQINGEIPQSTLWVAGALWSVLFGLMVWVLISLNQQGGDLKVIANQQINNTAEFRRIDSNLDRVEDHNRDQDKRITILEARR